MLEVAMTRISSVILWYHFAFMAISLALFGLSASAILVYARPSMFARERLERQLVIFSLLCALSVVALIDVVEVRYGSRSLQTCPKPR